jgi:cation:H+ antiporter
MTLGMTLLYFGAEWLVTGSSEVALRFGISPLVVGLTIVAFGTSAPELLVGLKANLQSPPQGDIALGNVVGSNIFNIALILGVGAMIRPIVIHSQIIKRELPILLVVSVAFVAMLWDGEVARWEGIVLTVGIIAYVIASLRQAKKEPQQGQFDESEQKELEQAKKPGRLKVDLFLIVVGLAALTFGADRLVTSGMELAHIFGVPEAIIALTFFALGTSLPELATSVVASMKNQGDIITGNAVGSCIFNILAVVGITAMVAPLNAKEVKPEDLWVMVGVVVVVLPFMWTRKRLSRVEGCILVLGSVAYVVYLGLRSGVI